MSKIYNKLETFTTQFKIKLFDKTHSHSRFTPKGVLWPEEGIVAQTSCLQRKCHCLRLKRPSANSSTNPPSTFATLNYPHSAAKKNTHPDQVVALHVGQRVVIASQTDEETLTTYSSGYCGIVTSDRIDDAFGLVRSPKQPNCSQMNLRSSLNQRS